MPCFQPLKGYKAADGRFVSYSRDCGSLEPMCVPCGQCLGCRLKRGRDWSVRMVNEARYHEHNTFPTYTYSDEHYPESGSAQVRDMQLLHKALRSRETRIAKKEGREPVPIRFVTVSDYSPTWRTHVHEILYGSHFPDLRPWRKSSLGNLVYRSDELEELWGKGHVEVGEVTLQSCGYVARHNIQKVNGPRALAHYHRINPVTGEIVQLDPEFLLCSLKPGIGSRWFDEFESDVFPCDFIVVDGVKLPVPDYYVRKLKNRYRNKGSVAPAPFKLAETIEELRTGIFALDDFAPIREARERAALDPHQVWNNSPERLEVREECQRLRALRLKRDGVL